MTKPVVGLVLAGGGARAAYQVGVLMAVARMLPRHAVSPFQVISGTSAGAINAVGLAAGAQHFRRTTAHLVRMWQSVRVEDVYRVDAPYFVKAFLQWGGSLLTGGKLVHTPPSFLDNRPLYHYLTRTVQLEGIETAIQSGALRALALTASCYTTGQSVSFFEGNEQYEPWHRHQRCGQRERLSIEHLMATSAIPLLFPSARVDGRHYCDGAIRQMAPLSPALHLGAERLFVINLVDHQERHAERRHAQQATAPSLAQIFGHLLDSIFMDSLSADMERLARVNHTVSLLDEYTRDHNTALKRVEVFNISPSVSLDSIAHRHFDGFPATMRFLLRGAGAMRQRGSALASYLLFHPAYGKELVELGYKDAFAKKNEIMNFLSGR